MNTNNNNTTGAQHPDIEAFLVIHGPENAYLFHENPFESPLQWLEYDTQTGQLDFILDAGHIENFGIPIEDHIGTYLKNITDIVVALKDGAIVKEETIYPLVVH